MAGGGSRAFGFKRDGVTIIEAEVRAVRWAVRQIINGKKLRETTTGLNRRVRR